MTKHQVLAKADTPQHYVVAMTAGLSDLGTQLCKQYVSSNADLYLLDEDHVALAHQAIRFRQNNQRLRGIPCNINSTASVQNAIREITSHAPPIYLWMHAEILNLTDFERLDKAFDSFLQHFELRQKGHLLFFIHDADQKEIEKILRSKLSTSTHSSAIKIKLITSKSIKLSKIVNISIPFTRQDEEIYTVSL